jgi:hypothetical protein
MGLIVVITQPEVTIGMNCPALTRYIAGNEQANCHFVVGLCCSPTLI